MPDEAFLRMTADIVTATVSKPGIATDGLHEIIREVYDALVGAMAPAQEPAPPPVPAVDPKKSVFRDYIICLEDGEKLKTLTRHLSTKYGMTPFDYRRRWGLPDSYPMTCPGYSDRRAEIARKLGLGHRMKAEPERIPEIEPETGLSYIADDPDLSKDVEVTKVPARKRGRKPKEK